ncbi:MAG: tRNA (adenosine(37)-N6)-dimethylallyltransferase MiaA [Syntrophomonadaceae bacterium]|nr:tRNA (adenosine(37)-N6)-dimethylallyltransferase MiaA [Syntrophomonadaceae bacterium]
MPPLVVIVGPTAVGKSRLAVKLAQKLNGEVISGDAFQVYQGLNLGTAKLSASEREGIPHHLIDIVPPQENFSVAAYRKLAVQTIKEIHERGNLPFLVGGTGLYISAVIYNYTFPEMPTDYELRERLKDLERNKGPFCLYQKLQEVDPIAAANIKAKDVRRVIRALEVYHLTGRPLSSFHRLKDNPEPRYRLALIGLQMDRTLLYTRINQRVEEMLRLGLVEEVKSLLDQGCSPASNAMQALGYKEIVGFLQHQYDLPTAVELIKRNTRRYAKRQLTWFKRDSRIKWYNVELAANEEELVEGIYLEICRTLNLRVE